MRYNALYDLAPLAALAVHVAAAKSGSQAIASSLVGTTGGLAFAAWAGGDPWVTLSALVTMSLLNVSLVFCSLRHVAIDTLSLHKFDVIMARRLRAASIDADAYSNMSPEDILTDENSRFLFFTEEDMFPAVPLVLGADLDQSLTPSNCAVRSWLVLRCVLPVIATTL